MAALDSARLKLGRADQHLEWLAQDLRRIASENQAVLPKQIRVEPGQRVEVIPPVIPGPEWGLFIGDCVQNLRATLDHTAWSLTPVSVRLAHPRKPQFPIFDDPDAYHKHGEWRIGDIDPATKTIIESLQPYNQSEPKTDSLYLLEVLSNIDKHRVIHAVAQSVRRVEATTLHGSMQLVEDTTGKRLPTFAISPEDSEAHEFHADVTVTLSVLFSDSEDATNRRVVSTLREIRARVAEVIDTLEPYGV